MNDVRIKFDTGNLISVAAIIALMVMFYHIRDLILTLTVSLVIATFAESFVTLGKKVSFPRVVSVVLFYTLIVILFGGLILFFVPVMITELGSLQGLYPEITSYVEDARLLQGIATQEVPLSSVVSEGGNNFIQNLFRNVSVLVGGIVNFIILFVVSFYLSVQDGGIERFIRIIVPLKHEDYAVDLWRRTRVKIGAWFNGQLLLALILTILTYIGLTIIGTPYALLLAMLAGVFGMIPYGIILALVPAVAIAFVNGGWKLALIVFIMYWVIQQITDYVLQPLILKKLTGLPTLVVILSIVIAGSLAGIMGVIIAVPVAVFILEMVHDREHSKKRILDELEHIENTNSIIDIQHDEE